MRETGPGDVLKVWLYAAASVFLGAWISPLFYNAGKALAEVSVSKQTNGALEWLAVRCRTMEFPAFFQIAIVVMAVVLFLPFADWLRGGRTAESGKIGGLRLPEGARNLTNGQRLVRNPHGPRQALTGFFGVSSLFFTLAVVLLLAGVFEWKPQAEPLARLLPRVVLGSVVLAWLQEILFRGIAMGVFLRAMRPAAALGLSAVLFAMIHFLSPQPGVNVLDPEAAGVGFELLRKIAAQFSEPRMVVGTFAPMLALGGVLAFARWKTASLWLPVGLHAGWIFVSSLLASTTTAASRPDSLLWILSGANLQQGLVPLVGILIAGALVTRLTTADHAPENPA